MGWKNIQSYVPFTEKELNDRELILKMLKYEDSLMLSDQIIEYYKNPLNDTRKTLNAFYSTHRLVLEKFGFDTSDESVSIYRQIFSTYYKSPYEYDKEVMNAVVYMRENKCVYYTSQIINVGDKLPDCNVLKLCGKENISLYETMGDADYVFVGAFSTS